MVVTVVGDLPIGIQLRKRLLTNGINLLEEQKTMANVFDLTPERMVPEWKIRSMERLAQLDQLERENNELREIFKQFTFDKKQEF